MENFKYVKAKKSVMNSHVFITLFQQWSTQDYSGFLYIPHFKTDLKYQLFNPEIYCFYL